jgi:4-diphosphocytidyl-2-C-methyl-D-erythritol kinase
MLSDRAPAKINLTLHVLGRRADGFHDLESLVVFAGIADRLELEPGEVLRVSTEGDFAQAAGPEDDNLVARAARALAALVPDLRLGHFRLAKRIPVAAGLGGGSSDAAAALRLLAELNGLAAGDPRLHEAAAMTGSDVPVCLQPRASLMLGRGEHVVRGMRLPRLHAILVNPRRPVPTAGVFRALNIAPGQTRCAPSGQPPIRDVPALLHCLAERRNDMEDAAIALEPLVGTALEALRAQGAVRLARMSGSGATVFGLVEDRAAALSVARSLRASHCDWWVAPTVLR